MQTEQLILPLSNDWANVEMSDREYLQAAYERLPKRIRRTGSLETLLKHEPSAKVLRMHAMAIKARLEHGDTDQDH